MGDPQEVEVMAVEVSADKVVVVDSAGFLPSRLPLLAPRIVFLHHLIHSRRRALPISSI